MISETCIASVVWNVALPSEGFLGVFLLFILSCTTVKPVFDEEEEKEDVTALGFVFSYAHSHVSFQPTTKESAKGEKPSWKKN